MLPPNIVIDLTHGTAYMQVQKPLPLARAELDLLCARVGLEAAEVSAAVLDDVMEDGEGTRHSARRLTITWGSAAPLDIEGAAPLDKLPKKKRKPASGDLVQPVKRRRVRKAKADAAGVDG